MLPQSKTGRAKKPTRDGGTSLVKLGLGLEKEANLTYWRNDLHLRFKPSATRRKQRKDGLLHGCYESYVVTEDGDEQVLEVTSDWVLRNISVQAREILHRVQKDWYEEHADNYGRKEIGFLTIQGNDTIMEDDKEKKMEYIFDERQISKIRYVPAKMITTAGGKQKKLPERWRGLIRGLNNQRDKFVWLDWDWIKKIFPIHSLVL
jgi:hypothetical protein